MYRCVDALLGAKRVLEPNVRPGDNVAIVGSTDVDQMHYQALAAEANALGAETTVGLMTPRLAYGRPAPKPLHEMARNADLAILTASTSLAHTKTALDVLKAGGRCLTFPAPRNQ